jgi:hypothetical protein
MGPGPSRKEPLAMSSRTSKWSLCLLTLSLAAAAAAETRVGVVAGPNFARFSGTLAPPEITFSGSTRLGLGGVVETDLSPRVSLGCEPMLLQKGTSFSGWGSAQGTTGTIDMTYLEVPLLARYSFGSPGFRLFVTAGPTLGFRRTATLTRDDTGPLGTSEDIEDITQGLDLGLSAGGGVAVPLGRFRVFAEARYSVGLLPVEDVPPGWAYSFERGPFNRGLLVNVGATIGLGR